MLYSAQSAANTRQLRELYNAYSAQDESRTWQVIAEGWYHFLLQAADANVVAVLNEHQRNTGQATTTTKTKKGKQDSSGGVGAGTRDDPVRYEDSPEAESKASNRA